MTTVYYYDRPRKSWRGINLPDGFQDPDQMRDFIDKCKISKLAKRSVYVEAMKVYTTWEREWWKEHGEDMAE